MSEDTQGGRDARLLAALAEPLGPHRAPFYVKGSYQGHPDGWYIINAGAQKATYLGRNVIFAERRILELLRDAQTAEAV